MFAPLVVAAAGVIDSSSGSCPPNTLCNPLQFNTICGLVKGVLNAAMVIGVPIAVLFIVWAGLQFVLAQGNAEKLSSARRNFLNVLIGIAIFVGASLIATVITKTIESLGVTGISDCS